MQQRKPPARASVPEQRPKPKIIRITLETRFGHRLRAVRRERDITQLEMATRFGMDRSHISDLERGCKSVSLAMVEVIAKGFNMTLSEFLNGI